MKNHQSIEHWKAMHKDNSYFDNHRCYQNREHLDGVSQIQMLLKLNLLDTVLDVGGGYGRLGFHFHSRVKKWRVLDIGQSAMDEGVHWMKRLLIRNVTFRKYDGQHIDAPGRGYSAGVCMCVMQHLPISLQVQLTKEIRRTCRRFVIQYLEFNRRYDAKPIRNKPGEQCRGITYQQILDRHPNATMLRRLFGKRIWWWVLENRDNPKGM